MKFFSALIGIALAGAAGYFLEPGIRPSLVAERKPEGEAPGGGPAKPVPAPPPAETPAPEPESDPEPMPLAPPAWVAGLTPAQLPEKVTLKQGAEIPIDGLNVPATLPAGTPVTPVRIEGEELVFTSLVGSAEGRVAVMQTNLVEVLGNAPPPPPVATIDPEPEPEPEPEPMPEPEPTGLTPDGIVQAMQDSIKAGDIQEFEFAQVLSWTPGEETQRDGKTYQSGTAKYKAETIFGVKEIEAQALIEEAKVVLWIWPKSGMEIK